MNRAIRVVAVLACLAVVGCGHSQPAPPPALAEKPAVRPAEAPPAAAPVAPAPPISPIVAEVKGFADRACACKDTLCAEQVQRDFMTFINKHADAHGSDQEKQVIEADAERMMKCIMEVQASAAPTPPAPLARAPVAADLVAYTAGIPGKGPLRAVIKTSLGPLQCTLEEKLAPVTVANFVGLARGLHPFVDPKTGAVVTRPFYDGLTFHRIVAGFMAQGGDPLGTGSGGPGYKFGNEISATLRHDKPGTLSMANAGPDTNGSQFFVTFAPAPSLDGSYNVFGHCDGKATLAKLAAVETHPGPSGEPSQPTVAPVIESIVISRGKRR